MRNLKKLLAVLVTVAIMVTAIVPAFAAVDPATLSKDISDTDVKAAVGRLAAFGVVSGKDDGQYHPELNVTRDEFAKLVVEALGLGSAADVAKTPTKFSDVAADKWSTGYINVAVGQGIINGRPDGTFAPDANVTYAEAVTMLVRALGYKDKWLIGNWPDNFLAKAAELKITNKVKVSAGGFADRGSVAIMVNNALDANPVYQSEYGDDTTSNKWTKSDDTLAVEKLKISKFKDVRITATPKVDEDLKDNEVTVDTKITDDDLTTLKVVETGLAADSLLGVKADIYTNDDNDIVYVDPSSDIVKYDQLKATTDSGKDIKLVNADKSYAYHRNSKNEVDATIYINNDSKTASDVTSKIGDELFGKIVLDEDNKIIFADLYDWTTKALLVKSVDTTNNSITAYTTGSDGDTTTIKLSSADAYSFMMSDGSVIKLADIKADDVLYKAKVSERGDDNVWRFVVVRNTVTGKVDGINDDDSITVANTDYSFVDDQTDYTFDKDDTITTYSFGEQDKLSDIVGENVTLLLNIAGDVRYVRSEVDASSGAQYGVLENAWANADSYVKIYTPDDKDASYKYDTDKVYIGSSDAPIDDLDANSATYKNELVKYKVNKDGEISELRIYPASGSTIAQYGISSDAESIKIGTTTYYVTDSTKFFNVDDGTTATTRVAPSVVTWDDIKDADMDTGNTVAVDFTADSNGNLTSLVFTNYYNLVASEAKVAVVTSKTMNADGDWVVGITPFDGTATTYKLSTSGATYKGAVVEYTVSGGDIVPVNLVNPNNLKSSTTTLDNTATITRAVYGTVTDKNGSVITVAGKSVKITSKTLVYKYVLKSSGVFKEIDVADASDVSEGDHAVIVYEIAHGTTGESSQAEVVYVIDDSAL